MAPPNLQATPTPAPPPPLLLRLLVLPPPPPKSALASNVLRDISNNNPPRPLPTTAPLPPPPLQKGKDPPPPPAAAALNAIPCPSRKPPPPPPLRSMPLSSSEGPRDMYSIGESPHEAVLFLPSMRRKKGKRWQFCVANLFPPPSSVSVFAVSLFHFFKFQHFQKVGMAPRAPSLLPSSPAPLPPSPAVLARECVG